MSTGLVICSACKRVVHQDGPRVNDVTTWTHCEDGSPRCVNASSDYPEALEEIVGRVCYHDGGFAGRGYPHGVREGGTITIGTPHGLSARPELSANRDPFTGRRRGGLGTLRNGPCPCGSGRKAKRCCR